MASLRRFKDDVKEVADGYDCGIGLGASPTLRRAIFWRPSSWRHTRRPECGACIITRYKSHT